MHGLLADARKLTHVAYLRRDPTGARLLGIRRVASQSVLSRFFAGFTSASLTCATSLFTLALGLNRLPSTKKGYTWTWIRRGSYEDGHQEGARVGYPARVSSPLSASASGGVG